MSARSNLKAKLAGGAMAVALAASAIAALPAQAASPAPCAWNGSKKKIECQYGAVMSGQGRSGDWASADARYPGGTRYQVGCRISTNSCTWNRIAN